jgi:orotate phosphoribosyltransferase
MRSQDNSMPQTIRLDGLLRLGSSPGLSALIQTILPLRRKKETRPTLRIELAYLWFDLTALSYMAQAILVASDAFERVEVIIDELSDDKIRFLWRIGFWSLLQLDEPDSRIFCTPDPRRAQPDDFSQRINYLPLLSRDYEKEDDFVKPLVEDWYRMLHETMLFPLVADLDAIRSREFLYVLLWELVQNVKDHSNGDAVTLGGQYFLPDSEQLRKHISESAVKRIVKQHDLEIQHSTLRLRTQWLKASAKKAFLMLSCCDYGIGIPASIRQRFPDKYNSDGPALKAAFSLEASVRASSIAEYDVHGLAQVLRLLKQYGGYLCAQSGSAIFEYDGSLDVQLEHNLTEFFPGAQIQVLLPLIPERGFGHFQPLSVRLPADGDGGKAADQELYIHLSGMLTGVNNSVKLSEEGVRHSILNKVLAECAKSPDKPVYLDLSLFPPHRQFLSFLLRQLRKRRLFSGVICLNASPQIMTLISSCQRLDESELLADAELSELHIADKDLSTVVSRGESGWYLPLIVPVSSPSLQSNEINVLWLGLAGIPIALRPALHAALDLLYESEEELNIGEIWHRIVSVNPNLTKGLGDQNEQLLRNLETGLRGMSRFNPHILSCSLTRFRIALSPLSLFERSCHALFDSFKTTMLPKALHDKPADENDYIYSFGWRSEQNRFRRHFFNLWKIFVDYKVLNTCAKALVLRSFAELGENLLFARVAIAVTPSAGIIGREVSKLLGIDFREVPSIYDINNPDWLPVNCQEPALIIDDVIDTGRLTQLVMERLQNANVPCVAVLVALKNLKGETGKTINNVPIISISEVDLGFVSTEEAKVLVNAGKYYEIDPHSLEPLHPRSFHPDPERQTMRDRLDLLKRANAIPFGHFIRYDHHFSIYFSIELALEDPDFERAVLAWLQKAISTFAMATKCEKVSVIYPYYSPVYHLVDRLISKPPAFFGVSSIKFSIARPVQLSALRLILRTS